MADGNEVSLGTIAEKLSGLTTKVGTMDSFLKVSAAVGGTAIVGAAIAFLYVIGSISSVQGTLGEINGKVGEVRGQMNGLGTSNGASSDLTAIRELLEEVLKRLPPPQNTPPQKSGALELPPQINGWLGTKIERPSDLAQATGAITSSGTKDSSVWVYTQDPVTAERLRELNPQ